MKGKGKANILVNTMALCGYEKYYSMGPYLDGRFRYDHEKGEKNPPPIPEGASFLPPLRKPPPEAEETGKGEA